MLPGKIHFSKLILIDSHECLKPVGANTTIAHSRQILWILVAIHIVREIFSKCVSCFRIKPRSITQLMGDLPHERVIRSPPFPNVGIDFAGPLLYKITRYSRMYEKNSDFLARKASPSKKISENGSYFQW